MRLSILVTLGLSALVHAFSDEPPKDWHKALAGIPLTQFRALAPRFHRRLEGRSSHSHIYVATEKNTLAAIYPNNGTLAWRQSFDPLDHLVNFKAHSHFISTLSGPGGANLRIYEAARGHVLWEIPLHSPALGVLSDPIDTSTDIVYAADVFDVFVLTNRNTVRRISILDGTIKWTWSPPDDVSLNLHSRIVLSGTDLYVISLSKSFASYTSHITALSAETGLQSNSYPVPGTLQSGLSDLLVLDYTPDPSLVWVEKGYLKRLSLHNRKVTTLEGVKYANGRLKDIGLGEHGMFVALREDETAVVFRVTDVVGQDPKLVWTFLDSAPNDKQSPSIYSGGVDKDGKPYVSRVFYAFAAKAAALELYIPQGRDSKGYRSIVPLDYNTMQHGVISHVTLDVADLGEDKYLSRAVLVTSMGSIQLWKGHQLSWLREESLSDLHAVEIVDLPAKEIAEGGLGAKLKLDTIVDVLRGSAEGLAALSTSVTEAAQIAISEFISGRRPTPKPISRDAPNTSLSALPASLAPSSVYRDSFGFNKIIIAVTGTGKIFGIHSANGTILWSRILAIDTGMVTNEEGLRPKLYVLQSVLDGFTRPAVVVVANRHDGEGSVTVHLDVVTGEPVKSSKGLLPAHFKKTITADVMPLFGIDTPRSLLLLAKDTTASIYPSSPASHHLTVGAHFTQLSGEPLDILTGYSLDVADQQASPLLQGVQLWEISFGSTGEKVLYTFKPPRTSVASLGKVMGDRTTLYKYLNPHVVGVVTDAAGSTNGIYLIDGVTGAVLYHTTVESKQGSKVLATMSENWLVYTFIGVNGEDGWGQKVVSVEVYEGNGKNDKTKSSEISSHSNEMGRLTIFSNSYIFPHTLETIAMTSTKYGISAKDLIVATAEGQIQSIPRRLLDPRRHKEKPSTADAEELLIPYDPVIFDDHKRVLSKEFDVLNTQTIVTSPALLESTSLVFTYGHDLFFTRVSPSGTFDVLSENFNKIQLVLIIGALSAAIFVVRPIVKRRQLHQAWYS